MPSFPALTPAAATAAEGTLGPAAEPALEMLPLYPGLGLFALLLALQHVLAPPIRRHLRDREPLITSIGGGMAVTYVFVHLLPELDKAHALFGRLIFVLTLFAFLVQYLVAERLYRQRTHELERAEYGMYVVKLAQAWIYNWLIVFGAPLEFEELGVRTLAVGVALFLHVAHGDFFFGKEFPRWFDGTGRFVLALAPVAGWASSVLATRQNETINDIVIALLAGMILYAVFTEDLPERGTTRAPWFLAGVASFLFLFVGLAG